MGVSKGKRFRVLERDAWTCRYCGRSSPDVELHVDHVYPRSRGGNDSVDNLVTACRDCNGGKSDRVLSVLPPDVPAPEVTFPHADGCRECRANGNPFEIRGASSEVPCDGGYRAFYQCSKGHAWNTWWSSRRRMTSTELYEALSIAFVERAFPCGAAS